MTKYIFVTGGVVSGLGKVLTHQFPFDGVRSNKNIGYKTENGGREINFSLPPFIIITISNNYLTYLFS